MQFAFVVMGGDGLNTTGTGGYGFETDRYGRGSGSLSVPVQFSSVRATDRQYDVQAAECCI